MEWYAIVCPICGWRHSPKRFSQRREPIVYPVQIVTGGGRARGFRVLRYLPWSSLPNFKGTIAWEGIKCLYARLAATYDKYFEVLGFLSPRMKMLLQQLRGQYEMSYGVESPNYSALYARSPTDIAEAYHVDLDYSKTYESLLTPLVM